jgi:hypothetical protein
MTPKLGPDTCSRKSMAETYLLAMRGPVQRIEIQRVEIQIDGGAWVPVTIDQDHDAEFAWKFWSLAWKQPAKGEHTTTSRAIDTAGNVQPAMDDPHIGKKHTYWESNGQVTRRRRNRIQGRLSIGLNRTSPCPVRPSHGD